jgi:steroid delta-isomerase
MPVSERAERLVDRYLELHAANQLAALLELFAADATLEDPVGSPIRRGIAAISDFYRDTHARNGHLVLERVGRVLACADEAAAHVRARFAAPAGSPTVDVIYVFRVDGEGRIGSLRAFF